ncbi:MAG: hypothetical protein LBK04_01785 [Clostridiales Family XIII bacterium]|nr:hypothetical protein [Clostridiales Family XIII bacterium]
MFELIMTRGERAGRLGRRAVTAWLLSLAFCAGIIYIPAAYAAEADMATIEVRQAFTDSDPSSGADAAFAYRLTPKAASNPMPAGGGPGGYDFTVTGTDQSAVSIDFSGERPGIYAYEISHVTAARAYYAYDTQVYTLQVFLKNDRSTLVVISKSDGDKAAAAAFEHTRNAPPSAPPETPATPDPPAPADPAPAAPGPAFVPDTPTADPNASTLLDDQTGNVFTDLANGNVPLGGGGSSANEVWSLLSLVLVLLGFAIAAVVMVSIIRRKPEEDDAGKEGAGKDDAGKEGAGKDVAGKEGAINLTYRDLFGGAAVLLSLLTLLLWLIFDDLSNPMAWINDKTAIVAIPFVVQVALFTLRGKKRAPAHKARAEKEGAA